MKKKNLILKSLIAGLLTITLVSCGSKGETGPQGPQGEPGTPGTPGQDGDDGISIVSITLTSSDGLVDTYTILFSDGSTSTFTVTNGESVTIVRIEKTSSSGLVDTYTIYFSNGATYTFSVTNGMDGSVVSVVSITLTSSEGLIDTYTIKYSDGSEFTFSVSNGEDGATPYIGDNGNWWIDGEDTGVLADPEKANNVPLTELSSGLTYTPMTLKGKSGFVVTHWSEEIFLSCDYGEDYSKHLVIPNYVGHMPVIGITEDAFYDLKNESYVEKITISRNMVWMGDEAFAIESLKEFDFNNANIETISNYAFRYTKLTSLNLPSSVTKIGDYAFADSTISKINLDNITYFGNHSFEDTYFNYIYLDKDVEYVGTNAFYSTRVYLEHASKPTTWASVITSTNDRNAYVYGNCFRNDEYIYSYGTVYQYIGSKTKISIPSVIDSYPTIKIGYGFAAGINSFETDLEEIVVPSTVRTIDQFTFLCDGVMVFLPSSITRVPSTWFNNNVKNRYIAFETTSTVYIYNDMNDDGSTTSPLNAIDALEEYQRVGFGIKYSDVTYDLASDTYYQENLLSYSILARMSPLPANYTIKNKFNNKSVSEILTAAFPYTNNGTVKFIIIEDGIDKIRPLSFYTSDRTYISIPSSVDTINAQGIYLSNSSSRIFVEHSSKPVDWDTYWTNLSSSYIQWGTYYDDFSITSDGLFLYTTTVSGVGIELVEYLGSSNTIRIPRSIDGKNVVKIRTGFLTKSSYRYIYIPSEVKNVESKAFENTSYSTWYVYLETSEVPSTWNSQWYYNSYYGSTTNYLSMNYDYSFDY